MARPKSAKRKRQLTELFIEKAKPEERAYLVWDEKQHGLVLQMQPTGAKAWKAIYRFNGRPRWYHIGKASAVGLKDARLLAAEVMLAAAKGTDMAANRKAQRSVGTFAELHDRYLEHAKRVNKSWEQSDRLVRRYARGRWANLQASAITRADVKSMLAPMEATPILRNQVLAACSAVFSWGVKEDLLRDNPCKLIERNKTTARERVASETELPLLWSAFEKAGMQGAALKAVLLSGQRPGECARMRHEHRKDGWWQMPGKPVPELGWKGTKNGEDHAVWLPPAVRDIIASTNGETTGFVFAGSRGRPINDLDGTMRAICEQLQLTDPIKPHDLRRTHGSWITGLGFGRDAMNRIQNHKEGGIADVYDRFQYRDENKRIMEAVAAHIMALVNGQEEAAANVISLKR